MRKVIIIPPLATAIILGIYFTSHTKSSIPPEMAVLIAFVLMGLLMVGAWVFASEF